MTMTPGEKAKSKYFKYKAYQQAYQRKRKENETPEQKEQRLKYQREYTRKYQRKRKENETPEQREKRLKYHREYTRKYQRKYLENETPEQKEKRLAYHREYQRKRREMRRRVINRPNNLTYTEEMELERKKRERVNAAYAKKPKRERKKRTYFPKAQKVEPKEYPKVDPDNDKYREVVKLAAKAYRALSADEKLERIRIAYRNR
jgi:hypothetical protein